MNRGLGCNHSMEHRCAQRLARFLWIAAGAGTGTATMANHAGGARAVSPGFRSWWIPRR